MVDKKMGFVKTPHVKSEYKYVNIVCDFLFFVAKSV